MYFNRAIQNIIFRRLSCVLLPHYDKITCFKNFGPAIIKYSNHEIELRGASKESSLRSHSGIDPLYGLSWSSDDTLRLLFSY